MALVEFDECAEWQAEWYGFIHSLYTYPSHLLIPFLGTACLSVRPGPSVARSEHNNKQTIVAAEQCIEKASHCVLTWSVGWRNI